MSREFRKHLARCILFAAGAICITATTGCQMESMTGVLGPLPFYPAEMTQGIPQFTTSPQYVFSDDVIAAKSHDPEANKQTQSVAK